MSLHMSGRCERSCFHLFAAIKLFNSPLSTVIMCNLDVTFDFEKDSTRALVSCQVYLIVTINWRAFSFCLCGQASDQLYRFVVVNHLH